LYALIQSDLYCFFNQPPLEW